MSTAVMNTLLDKLVAGAISPDERESLVGNLQIIEQDSTRPAAERMAAIVLRAALEARSLTHAASGR